MIYKRHKWGAKASSKSLEDSSVACVRCGCVRQYVGGIATYYIAAGEQTHDRYAPPCNSDNLAAVEAEYDVTNCCNPRYVSHYTGKAK